MQHSLSLIHCNFTSGQIATEHRFVADFWRVLIHDKGGEGAKSCMIML